MNGNGSARTITASALDRIAQCPASACLPQVNTVSAYSERGTVIHEFIAQALTKGPQWARDNVREDYRDDTSRIPIEEILAMFDGTPDVELSLAYDLATGRGRVLGRNRDYRSATRTEIVGTVDVVQVNRHDLTLADWKAGYQDVPAPERNWQLRFLALAAARTFNRDLVYASIVKVSDELIPIGTVFGPEALREIECDLHQVLRQVAGTNLALKDGKTPPLTSSEHCGWCPVFPICPAKIGLLRAVLDGCLPNDQDTITEDTAAIAWQRLTEAEAVLTRTREILTQYAEGTPFALPSGKVVGPYDSSREQVIGERARPVLTDLFGREVAATACPVSIETTKRSIRDSLRPIAKETGETLKALTKKAHDALRAAKAMERQVTTKVGEHTPK